MNLYIDGDLMIHRCVWNNNENGFKKKAIDLLEDVVHETQADNGKLAIRGANNFRKDLFPDYKVNRKRNEDPKIKEMFSMAYKYLTNEMEAIPAEGQEADDLLAIWQTEEPGIIVSIDKDMLQVPGLHFNNARWEYITVSEEEANYNLHKQILMGDSSDNIKGLTGVGPKRAESLLKGRGADLRKKVCKAWKDQYGKGWEEALQLTTDLVYLRRKPEDRYLIV